MATHSSVLPWNAAREGGAWWAAISGVAQSWTQLKRLSSSSSGKEPTRHCRRRKRRGFHPWVEAQLNPTEAT